MWPHFFTLADVHAMFVRVAFAIWKRRGLPSTDMTHSTKESIVCTLAAGAALMSGRLARVTGRACAKYIQMTIVRWAVELCPESLLDEYVAGGYGHRYHHVPCVAVQSTDDAPEQRFAMAVRSALIPLLIKGRPLHVRMARCASTCVKADWVFKNLCEPTGTPLKSAPRTIKLLYVSLALSVHLAKKEFIREVFELDVSKFLGGGKYPARHKRKKPNRRANYGMAFDAYTRKCHPLTPDINSMSPIVGGMIRARSIGTVIKVIRDCLALESVTLAQCRQFSTYWYASFNRWRPGDLSDEARRVGKMCAMILGFHKHENVSLVWRYKSGKYCAWCNRWKPSKRKLRQCSGCREICYCSRKHQKLHWDKEHMTMCSKNTHMMGWGPEADEKGASS